MHLLLYLVLGLLILLIAIDQLTCGLRVVPRNADNNLIKIEIAFWRSDDPGHQLA